MISERDKIAVLWFIAIVAIGWAAISIVVNLNQANSLGDLQRRIAVLEQSQR